MVAVNRIPFGTTSFSNFILRNKIYVDKTDLIANLASNNAPVFLSRPRRFGKSTLVSTFEELFSHGLEKFKGLKIDTQNLWHDRTYKTLHLDFSVIQIKDQDLSFNDDLLSLLDDSFQESGFKSCLTSKIKNFTQYFDERFSDPTVDKLVLLIDEYDAPFTAQMNDPNEFAIRRDVLSNFFSNIKRYSDKFRFIFITGITRFSRDSLFADFHNLKDLSFDPTYEAIVGFTQDELEFYFKDYIENAALVLNQWEKTHKYTYDLILQKIKENYDGYSFDLKSLHRVYNPWPIVNFLNSPYRDFDSYWFNSGGYRPKILIDYLKSLLNKKHQVSLLDLLNENFKFPTTIEKLTPALESLVEGPFPYEAILYQAGYFTLKRVDVSNFYIGLPNLEVQEAFERLVLEKLINKTKLKLSRDYDTLVESAIEEKNISDFLGLLNALLNEFSYETVPTFKEAHFREIYKVTLRCMGFKTFAEEQLSSGRTDLEIYAQKYLYVIEFKIVDDNNEALIDKALNEAKTQMISRKYTVRLANFQNLKTVGLACVIVNQKKDEKHDKPFREVVRLEEVGEVKIETKKDS